MSKLRLDLNNPEFQQQLCRLQKDEQVAVIKTFKKLLSMDWNGVFHDKGLKWELIYSKKGPQNERLYSLRVTQSCRIVAYREQDWLRVLTIHPDHDSAYK